MLFILFFVAILTVFFLRQNHRKNEPFHPPPGPKGLPFIGNLHQFDASKPHVYFTELGKIHGPIFSLRFGSKQVVVVQSAKLAKEVLQTQDRNFCGRPSMVGIQKLSYNGLDIAFAPYGEYQKKIKKISVVHLFSSKRVESFAPIREEEVSRMIEKISFLSSTSQIINLSDLLSSFARSNICRVAFGKRYKDDEGSSSKFDSLIREAEALFTSLFISDYFPYFGWLDKLTGQFSRLEKTCKDLDDFYEEIINDHLEPNKSNSEREDIVDVLLQLMKDRSLELTLDHVKAVLMIIFIAGADTSSAMVIWTMTELMKNPHSMKKVQDELREAIQNKVSINNNDLVKLEYFKAVVKETFRLQPATPLLVVHETIRKSTIEGYDILPKTLVYVNAWAIGRDPNSWKEPENFMPERFLGSSIDFKGNDFELIPFGAGRRICPGMNLGVASYELALANLLYYFDWELPSGLRKEDIDIDPLPGITMHKKNPLCLLAKKTNIYNYMIS
ncbi:6,7,8-trihydroxycoumarin synthase [Beta vulgaris subsp. vulgaris]|uniref:6,7,8-trihydroxycoumarin synthase n=1 Tax=Beta vulgaris subsp. vulgaris TaxID=3555 RepID=UPI0005402D8B|nr:6,7,8-trihydroxycoumarin synthase [Beta vulgaris subsp. vulgaris]